MASVEETPATWRANLRAGRRNLAARLVPGGFYHSILLLFSGTAAGQAIQVACIPLLTRLYSPEDFGTFALFVSIVSLLATISALRYEVAILLPRLESHAAGPPSTPRLVVTGNSW